VEPSFDLDAAPAIAEKLFGVRVVALPLPSERDQNFLLKDRSGEKFVLKIAGSLEDPIFLEAQNALLKHLAGQTPFTQRLVPTISGEELARVRAETGTTHFVRLVHYLPGVPLAEIRPHSDELLRDLGSKLGHLDRALMEFDHPAFHRDFHWDLANGNRLVEKFAPLISDPPLREAVLQCRLDFDPDLRRSVIHGDANDYNVLVDPDTMTVSGLIDFGDVVYSYTAGDLAIAIAYVVLDKSDPIAAAWCVIDGYTSKFALRENELDVLWRLVLLRLAMSACLAVYQQRLRPQNDYLLISQRLIRENLPRLLATDLRK
jgi:Ser/Thr protein kinase RdoA (MazF antagonist)